MNKNNWIKYSLIATAIFLLYMLPQHLFHEPQNSVCLHRRLLGFQCPLCGMTRAAYEIVRLNFVSAMKYNPVIMLIFFYFMADIAYAFFPQQKTLQAKKILLILTLASLIVLYIVRITSYFRG